MSHIIVDDITIVNVKEEPWHALSYLGWLKVHAFSPQAPPE
ncbi:hypothetical protein [Methylobacterium nigriterrae]